MPDTLEAVPGDATPARLLDAELALVRQMRGRLARDADGIWLTAERAALSYPDDGNAVCYQLEDSSFWFRHRNRCVTELLQRFPPAGALLDVGAGNGFVAAGLRQAGFPVTAMEPGVVGARNARRRGVETVICATLEQADFPPGSVAAFGLFDVLEHIDDDIGFLRRLRALLTEGGRLYLTVPAYQLLFSPEDRRAGHFRRYSLGRLASLLRTAGFVVEFASYLFSPLPVPIFLQRTVGDRLRRGGPRPQDQVRDHTRRSALSSVVDRILNYEVVSVRQRRAIPFGSSCIAVASARGIASP